MQVLRVNAKSEAGVKSLTFTPDGGLVAASSSQVTAWDATGAQTLTREFASPTWAGGTPALSPSGRYLAHWQHKLKLFDLAGAGPEPVAERGEGWMREIAFAPDSTEVALPGYTPRRWSVPSWEVIRSDPAPQHLVGSPYCTGAVSYSRDGRTIALSFAVNNPAKNRYEDGFRLFDRVTGAHRADLRAPYGHAHPTQIAFSPDGALVAGNFGPVLGVVSATDGKEAARIKTGTKHIIALAFTPDGSKLVTVGNDARVRVFDARTWTEAAGYEWKIGRLRCVAVAPDGLRMAAGSERGRVIVWDVDE